MKQLWNVLLTCCGVLLLTAARPSGNEQLPPDRWEHVNKTCLSASCDEPVNLQHLHELERNMNLLADPCENFYDYACGNWGREHVNGTTMMRVADEKLTANYVQLFEGWLHQKHKTSLGRTRAIVNVQTYHFGATAHYAGSERFERIDRTGATDRLGGTADPSAAAHLGGESFRSGSALQMDEVADKMLHYYAVCKESEDQSKLTLRGYMQELQLRGLLRQTPHNWQDTLARLARYGYAEHFIQLEVKQLNATRHMLRIMPPTAKERLVLSAELYQILSEYTQRTQAALIADFRRLEYDLAQIWSAACDGMPRDEEGECDLSEYMNYAELTQRCNEIDWQLYLGLQLGRPLRADDVLLVEYVATIKQIARYLNQADEQLLWLYTLARFLSHLQQQPHGILAEGAAASNCVRHMRKFFYLPLTQLYERAFYGSDRAQSDTVIHSVFEQLRAQFERTLLRNKMQLSPAALSFLRTKLNAMRLNIGNLPLNVTTKFYVDLVHDLNLTGNFYHNHLQALQHSYAQLRALTELPQQSPYHSISYHWPNFPDNVDATPYFFCLNNMIIIPHAYLQPPFYNHRFWPALLYGDLATTLGHELMHAFDTSFMVYNHVGNMAEMHQSIQTNLIYRRNLHCLQQGTDSEGERIADISGTRLALDAFLRDREFLQRNGKLFFLQFAQFFCNAANATVHKQEDPNHDGGSVRLEHTVAHMPEFAAIFNCPVGSAMHPHEKCEMW